MWLILWRGHTRCQSISFSPDGRLVLSQAQLIGQYVSGMLGARLFLALQKSIPALFRLLHFHQMEGKLSQGQKTGQSASGMPPLGR